MSTRSNLEQITGAASVVALGNLVSRALGLAREIVKSHLFGASGTVDAFNVAARVPTLLYDLLVGGMVNSSLVPVFAAYIEEKRADLWGLVSVLLNVVAVLMALLVILIGIFAPQVAYLMSGGSSPEVLALTTRLLRITVPTLLFLSLGGVVSALLYALRRFAYPALTAAAFNATIVVITLVFFRPLGITAMALGLLCAGLMSLLIQLPGLRGTGIRYHLMFRHPGLRRVALLYLPIILGLMIEVLISRPVTYNLASQTGTGGIAWMDYATTLWQFPQGLVATAVSFAVLPALASHAAAERIGHHTGPFRETLAQGVRLILLLIVPAAVGLFVLARPVVTLLFEHGSFTHFDTTMTASALRLYLLGLPFHAIDLLLVFAFYARQDTLTPALIGAGVTVIYVALAVLLLPVAGLFAIMIADAVKICLHALICGWLLRRRLGGGFAGVRRAFVRVLLAAAVMGLTLMIVLRAITIPLDGPGLLPEAITVIVPGLVGAGVYLLLISALRVEEISALTSMLRRLGR